MPLHSLCSTRRPAFASLLTTFLNAFFGEQLPFSVYLHVPLRDIQQDLQRVNEQIRRLGASVFVLKNTVSMVWSPRSLMSRVLALTCVTTTTPNTTQDKQKQLVCIHHSKSTNHSTEECRVQQTITDAHTTTPPTTATPSTTTTTTDQEHALPVATVQVPQVNEWSAVM